MPSTLMLLSNPHRPDPRVLLEARALVGAGIGVQLLAWGREPEYPRKSEEDGVRVERIGPLCATRSPMQVLSRLPRFWCSALRESRRMRFDVVHAHDFDTLPVGMAIARLSGKPVIYDAHELYAKMIQSEAGPLSGLVWALERCCSKRADEVITVSETIASELGRGRKRKVRLVTTSQDPSAVLGEDVRKIREDYGLTGFVVSYLGALEPGRFVEELAPAFSPGEKITVLVAGGGTLEPVVAKASLHDSSLKFVGRVGADEALRLTLASDLVAAMMDPSNQNNVIGTPGKIVNALALGRPVITTEGLKIAERIRSAGAGIVVPFDREAFRNAVVKAAASPGELAEMGRRGRALYEKEYSWERSRQELLDAYRALTRAA